MLTPEKRGSVLPNSGVAAIWALGEIGDSQTVEFLKAIAHDDKFKEVHEIAVEALKKIEQKEK